MVIEAVTLIVEGASAAQRYSASGPLRDTGRCGFMRKLFFTIEDSFIVVHPNFWADKTVVVSLEISF
jgi:hypothetical protein